MKVLYQNLIYIEYLGGDENIQPIYIMLCIKIGYKYISLFKKMI